MALYQGYRENRPGEFGSGIRSLMEQQDPPAPRRNEPPPEPGKPARQVTLDYHEILPNIDKVLSESELREDDTPRRASEPAAAPPTYRYLLQAGSYKSERDAERMKAKLALNGYEPAIQRVEIPARGTYYRVRLGPYPDKRALRLDRKRLAREGINAMALRLESP